MPTNERARMVFEQLQQHRDARDDAARHMREEDEPTLEDAQGDAEAHESGLLLEYVVSYLVRDREGGGHVHGLSYVEAESYPEAIGTAYLELRDKYSDAEGYDPPAVIGDEVPVVRMMDVEGLFGEDDDADTDDHDIIPFPNHPEA